MTAARVTTVTNTVQRPGTASPFVGLSVTIRLNVLGFADGGSVEKVSTRFVETDANGVWSVDLEVNDDIDPAGTYYTVHEGKIATWSIVVPPAADPVSLRDILVADPANPSPMVAGVPLPGEAVPAGYVWKTDGAGNGDYEEDTGGGGGGAPTGPAGGVLSGTYPNPGFAVDMATQAELDAETLARANTDTTLANLITAEATARANADALLAPKASPTFTGPVTVPAPTNPTDAATKQYVDNAVVGLLDFRGSYDASVNTFPAAGGSGTAGAVLKGDVWIASVGGTLGGVAVTASDIIVALVDAPGQTAGSWDLVPHDGAYVTLTGNQSIAGTKTFTSPPAVPDGSFAQSKVVGLGTAAAADTGTTSGKVPLLGTGGVLPIARLATGTPSGAKFVRDDGTLAAPSVSVPVGLLSARPTSTGSGAFYYATDTQATYIDTASGWVVDANVFYPLATAAGVTLSAYGHSYPQGTGAAALTSSYVSRLGAYLRCGAVANYAVPATNSWIQAWKAGQTAANGGVVLWDCTFNDLQFVDPTGSYKRSVIAFLEMVRGRVDTALASTINYTGTWSNVASTAGTNASGTNVKQTTTQNDGFQITWTGDRVCVILRGANGVGSGATFSVTSFDGTVTTGTTDNACPFVGQFAPVPILITGAGPGQHSLTITKTDAAATPLQVDSFCVPVNGTQATAGYTSLTSTTSPGPPATFRQPLIFMIKQPHIGPDSTTVNCDTWNAVLDTIVAGYPTGVYTVDASVTTPSGPWSATTHGYVDGVHPNDAGHQHYAEALIASVQAAVLPAPLGTLSYTDALAPVVTPVSQVDTFTRADNAFTIGTPSDAGQPWQNWRGRDKWGIASNQAYLAGFASTPNIITRDNGKANCTVSCMFPVAAGKIGGLAFRVVDINNHYRVSVSGLLEKVVAGTPSTLASFTACANGDTLAVVLSGTSIIVNKNGTQVASVTDSTFSSGRHGLYGKDNSSTGMRWSAYSAG